MSDKVTVRFESTMDSANSEPLLLSGPVQIFASVDLMYDLRDENGNIIKGEDGEALKAGLDNKRLIQEIKASNDSNIIVFVENVGANPTDQRNRGAYFRYIGNRLDRSLNCNVHEDWQEILLGTHSHENMKQLNSLAELPFGEDSKDKLVAVDGEGNFKLVENVELPILPPLPPEFVNKIKELEDYRKIEEPVDSEWHHLDAGLVELTDTYDWLRKDENGNYTNLAVGNCRELYHSLIKADKPLFLNKDGSFIQDTTSSKIALEIYEVNFDPLKKEEGYENVILDATNTNRSVLKVNLPFILTDADIINLFIDGKILSNLDYDIVERKENKLSIRFNRKTIENKKSEFTVLVSRGALDFLTIRDLFADGIVSIPEINQELIKLYIEGEFNRKPYIPQLYLTTDQYGNIHWDNKLLPTQYFYAKSITINENNIEHYFDRTLGKIKLVFEDAFFNIKNNDFPILLADQYFAFDVIYYETLTKESKKDLVYLLDRNSKYLSWNEDDEIIEDVTFTLIVIKNSANGSLADEIADKYVSKDDAVKILSHGKITLKDYAKATDLIGFSRIGHTHSQYALKDHDHDYKYANYHHTHPELCAILEAATGIDANKVNEWVNKLTGGIQGLVDEVELSLIENKRLSLSNLMVTEDIISAINKKIEDDSYNIDELKPLNGVVTLDRVVEYIIKFFELEYVYADQVKIPQDLIITNKLKGMKRDKYEKDTDIFFILRDILNPFISADDIKLKLIPSSTYSYLEFYRIMGESPVKIQDPMKIESWYGDSGKLLFKVILKNKDNEDCSYVSHTGITINTQPVLDAKYHSTEYPGFYEYDNNFNFQEKQDYYEPVNISWSNENIYDNYGLNFVELNQNGDSIMITPEFDFVYADYYAATLTEIEFKNAFKYDTSILDKFKRYSGSNDVEFKLHEEPGSERTSIDYITILISYENQNVNYEFLDERGIDIFEFFREKDNPEVPIDGTIYLCYYYPVSYEPVLAGDETVDTLKIRINKKEV